MTPFEKQYLFIAKLTLLVAVLSLAIPIINAQYPNNIEIAITSTLTLNAR